MASTVLILAFIIYNPFNWPAWVLGMVWIGLVLDVLLGLFTVIFGD